MMRSSSSSLEVRLVLGEGGSISVTDKDFQILKRRGSYTQSDDRRVLKMYRSKSSFPLLENT